MDARMFEIVSYAILKYYYKDQSIVWGYDWNSLTEESLSLYKTGRTNANDGGIDFVMKPLGRFFQVTETVDFKKYFLDIEKVEKYPITFVIKSTIDEDELKLKIKNDAEKKLGIVKLVEKFMECIEEIINIPKLLAYFQKAITENQLSNILQEIEEQSKIEFHLDEWKDDEEMLLDNV
ncbi:MAG: hypothetical protein LIO79_08815 [Rikenellaceae bacterium]|nr:hypothetical protein [Rikenellaceae bacterium]